MTALASEAHSPARGAAAEPASLRLPLLLGAEVILLAILRIPYDLGFSAFAFADRGSWLTVVALVAEGRRPGVDFGYPYGLLPIALSSAWFRLCGITPRAYQIASVMLGLVMAWAVARLIRVLRLPWIAVAIVIIALPFAIQSSYPSLAHALEAALLSLAIAEHAAGRRRSALALAAAACFAKPSMGYVYGFVLLCCIVADYLRRGVRIDWRSAWHELMPAALVVIALAIVLGATYGPVPLFTTLLPAAGMKNYAAFNFGFFRGIGSYFWYGLPVAGYFASVIGFWFAASLVLVIGGLRSLLRMLRRAGEPGSTRDEIVVAMAVLHVVFVTTFFAGPTSWSYYSYILVSGAAACCIGGRDSVIASWILVVLAASGQTGTRIQDLNDWKTRTPSPATAGLWAGAEQRGEWEAAVRAISGQRAIVLLPEGGAPLLFPNLLERNGYAYLTPGVALPQEIDTALGRFAAAPYAIAVIDPDYGWAFTLMPPVVAALKQRQPVFKNSFFAIYRRAPG